MIDSEEVTEYKWTGKQESSSAYSNGEEAFRLGMSINDNPYIDKFIDHNGADQWLCGYLAAREAQLNVNPMPNCTAVFVADRFEVRDSNCNVLFDKYGFHPHGKGNDK